MTVIMAISPIDGLVLRSAIVGGINAPKINEFLLPAR